MCHLCPTIDVDIRSAVNAAEGATAACRTGTLSKLCWSPPILCPILCPILWPVLWFVLLLSSSLSESSWLSSGFPLLSYTFAIVLMSLWVRTHHQCCLCPGDQTETSGLSLFVAFAAICRTALPEGCNLLRAFPAQLRSYFRSC